MNQLAKAMAQKTGSTEAAALAQIKAFTEAATEAMQQGKGVRIQGFGSFEVREVRARAGRDPRNGTPIQLPASRRVAFKAHDRLKQRI